MTIGGRRSGLPHTMLVQYLPDGPNMVIVGANSGMPHHHRLSVTQAGLS